MTANLTQSILQRWHDGINEGDVEGVLKLYHENAVLIPTFAPDPISTPAGIRRYFEALGSTQELSVKLRESSVLSHDLGSGKGAVSGLYDWHFVRDGVARDATARFSFVVDTNLPTPIVQHHSSAVPVNL